MSAESYVGQDFGELSRVAVLESLRAECAPKTLTFAM